MCSPGTLEFQRVGRRRLIVDNKAGPVSSDGGLPLLHELEQRMGLLRRFSECFTVRRVLVSLSSAYPFYGLFTRILENLRASPPAFV